MKRLNLKQACLLDVSGELGAEAGGILREHVETYPAAMFEYDQAIAQFKRLESLPPLESQMDQLALERMKQRVKDSLHDALKSRRKAARRRTIRRWFYRSMSMASGVAAALVIMAGVYIVHQHIAFRQARIMDAENTFQEVADSKLPYRANASISRLRSSIDSLGTDHVFDAQSGVGNAGIMRLFKALDKIPMPMSGADDAVVENDTIQ